MDSVKIIFFKMMIKNINKIFNLYYFKYKRFPILALVIAVIAIIIGCCYRVAILRRFNRNSPSLLLIYQHSIFIFKRNKIKISSSILFCKGVYYRNYAGQPQPGIYQYPIGLQPPKMTYYP